MNSSMQYLVSVSTPHEAQWVHEAGIGLIDLKDPSSGALAMLDIQVSKQIVQRLKSSQIQMHPVSVSATVGDESDCTQTLKQAIHARFDIGVDYVKLPMSIWSSPLHQQTLAHCLEQGYSLIAVLPPRLVRDQTLTNHLHGLKSKGYVGVMVDTTNKQSRLTDEVSLNMLGQFIVRSRQLGLLVGLAGGLQLRDRTELAALNPDYLGFRSGLCVDGKRENPLNQTLLQALATKVFDYHQNPTNPYDTARAEA